MSEDENTEDESTWKLLMHVGVCALAKGIYLAVYVLSSYGTDFWEKNG